MTSSSSHRFFVRWPDASAALGKDYAREWHRRLKYTLRRWLTTRSRRVVLDHVARSAAAQALLANAPRAFYPVMHKHLDRRFDANRRAGTVLDSIRGMERALGDDRAAELFGGVPLTLAVLPDATRVTLNLNRLTFHEGLWAIDLTRADGMRLYTISFGWTDATSLMIGCVQGPPREIDGLACVRDLTDAAHGLRPAHLLMAVLRLCAGAWLLTRLIGVDEAFQVKGRWNHRAVARRFDYVAFWQDAAGELMPDGNWQLPVTVARRALEDVPSKRRAMYRRRYALLDALAGSAREALQGRQDVKAPASTRPGEAGRPRVAST